MTKTMDLEDLVVQELAKTLIRPKNYDEYDELLLACIRDGTNAQVSSTLSMDELGR